MVYLYANNKNSGERKLAEGKKERRPFSDMQRKEGGMPLFRQEGLGSGII